MTALLLHSVDNGYCRVYYQKDNESKSLLCYQEEYTDQFMFYGCTPYGEPISSIDYQKIISKTPLPEGHSYIENALRKWLVKQATTDIQQKVNQYLVENNGQPTEFDMRINDLSRNIIERIESVYGRCYLIKINLRDDDQGNRNAIATLSHEENSGKAFNFCCDWASPMISESAKDLIMSWNETHDIAVMEKITQCLISLGAVPMIWV